MIFLYLSKILPAILAPFSLVLLLLIAGILLRRWRVMMIIAAFLLLLIPSMTSVATVLITSLERQYPDQPIENLPAAPAIVVLGGTIRAASGIHRSSHLVESSDRLLVAFRLYRAGKAPVILCSGGRLPILGETAEQPEAEVMRSLLEEWGVPAGAILVESGSANTHENGTRSFDLLSGRGIRRILLVTSAMHMPRASAVFRKAGFEVIPVPADFRTGWKNNSLAWIPTPQDLIDSQEALREWAGLLAYRVHGWADSR